MTQSGRAGWEQAAAPAWGWRISFGVLLAVMGPVAQAAPPSSGAAPQAAAMAAPAPAQAAPAAIIEFSAQVRRSHPKKSELNASGMIMVSRWGVRSEGVKENQRVHFIFLPERQTVLMLLPDQQSYVEYTGVDASRPVLPDDPSSPCRANPAVSCRNLGAVSWNGRQPVRWEINEKDAEGKTQRSYLYVDPRLQASIREEYPDGTIQEFVSIQEAPQPQTLFSVPTGYKKIVPSTDPAGGGSGGSAPAATGR